MSQIPAVAPSVGRIVHYQAYGTPGGEYPSVPRAAIVTAVDSSPEPGAIGICILNPTGMFFNSSVPYSEEPKPGHWNWMPYQKAKQAEDATK